MPGWLPDGQIDDPMVGKNAKPTKKGLLERVALARKMLVARWNKGDIKRVMKDKYEVDARSVERYLSRARSELIDDIHVGKDELQSDAYAFYSSIVADTGADLGKRLHAQERIDKLLGLEVHQHEHVHTHAGGVAVYLPENERDKKHKKKK